MMERKSYPTDLTDEQFALLAPIPTESGCCFKPTKWTMAIILNAIMYVVLAQASDRFPPLQLIRADGAYAGTLVDWVKETRNCVLQIVKRSADAQGFHVLPHRWIVERTLARLCRYRRLRADYEYRAKTSAAMIKLAMINLTLLRLAPERQS